MYCTRSTPPCGVPGCAGPLRGYMVYPGRVPGVHPPDLGLTSSVSRRLTSSRPRLRLGLDSVNLLTRPVKYSSPK